MKPIYIILLVVVLLGLGGGLAFFVSKKKKDSKKNNLQPPIFERKKPEQPTNNKVIANKSSVPAKKPSVTTVPESTKFDIQVSNLDIRNNSFDYYMHYGGIPYKGAFKGGLTRGVHIKKSFGAFVVKPRMNEERGSFDPSTKLTAKQQKMRGVTTKGGAAKARANGARPAVQANRWIDLFILDNNEKILKQLSVNIDTGETTKNAKIPKD